ncbi:MAG: lipoyl(octanoyl) transferase LipB [Cyclobacteriaceae bacterium]
MNKKTKFIHLGLRDYQEAWDIQEKIFKAVVDRKISNRKLPDDQQMETENHLIFCYHPHVFTLGKSGDENHLLANDAFLKQINATFYKINRGGDITYHGPGQIVGYPILDLDHFFTDIHKYLRLLEEAVILTLEEYGIEGGRIDGLTGVWLDWTDSKKARKICALGVKSSRWVTMHGFAFNVNTNLEYFNYIVPCGIPDKKVTSLQAELGREVDIKEVEEKLKKNLETVFEMSLVS